MRRHLLICAAILLLGKVSLSQPAFHLTDSVTYQLYLQKKWEQLLPEAEKAIKNKIDFYYLRVRAGVAAYELKNYRKAASHLERAYQISREDDFVNSYFYYALIMSGRKDEADALADRLPPDMLMKTGLKRKELVTGISVESLMSFNADFSGLQSEKIGTESDYSNYRSLLKKQFYKGIALDHHLLPGLDLYQNFSHIAIDRMQQFRSSVNWLDTMKSTGTSQYQYFISGRVQLGKGWVFLAAVTKMWGQSRYHIPEYVAPQYYNLLERRWDINDYVFTAGISKELIWMRPKAVAGIGKINGYHQFQTNLQVIIYPYGNLNFYLIPEVSVHIDESDPGAKLVFRQGAGIKTGPIWLSLDYAFGTMKNFYSGEGLVVYNMPESVRQKKGINLWLPLFNYRMEATLRFARSEKEGTTFVYTDQDHYIPKIYRFSENSILFSVKWNL
jgi:hypothetical protein